MKAAIITMHGIYNYGSVLQTFASCKMFEDKGITTEVIDYYPERLKGYGSFIQLYKDAKPFHGNTVRCLMVAIVNWPSYKLQKKVFSPFVNKYIKLSKRSDSYDELIRNYPDADIYCTGSDQVWNNFLDSDKKFDLGYFLQFVPNGVKKISYAASFGRSDFTESEKKVIKSYLDQYDAISVREKTGLEVIKEVNVALKKWCLDPTFMIDKRQWLEMAEPIKEKDYILVYKLHEDSKASEIAVQLGELLGKRVIRVSTALHRRIKGGETILLPSVGQFISYITNASLVVTDSFHATAFAVNLNIPFLSVRWKMFNDRIESILEITGLENRLISNYEEAEKVVNERIDFDSANLRLKEAVHESQAFFDRAVKGDRY